MGEFQTVAKRLKRYLSQHPLLCLWVTRWVAIFYGIRALQYRFAALSSIYIDSTAKVTGWSKVRIGRNTAIASGTWLNVNDRAGAQPSLIIGDNCLIGRNNFITVGKKVTIGDYCLTGTNCALVGSSHKVGNPNLPYISTGVANDAEIHIGANCFFGSGVTVVGSVSIGYGSVIGAGAMVLKDVPPLSIVIGNPGRVVKRYSVSRELWVPVDEYVEEPLISEAEYVANMRKKVGYYPLPISAARSLLGDV